MAGFAGVIAMEVNVSGVLTVSTVLFVHTRQRRRDGRRPRRNPRGQTPGGDGSHPRARRGPSRLGIQVLRGAVRIGPCGGELLRGPAQYARVRRSHRDGRERWRWPSTAESVNTIIKSIAASRGDRIWPRAIVVLPPAQGAAGVRIINLCVGIIRPDGQPVVLPVRQHQGLCQSEHIPTVCGISYFRGAAQQCARAAALICVDSAFVAARDRPDLGAHG